MSIEKKLREGSVHCKRRNNRVHRRMEKRQKNRKKWIYWGAATIFAVMLSVLLGLLMKKDPPPVLVPGAIVDSAVTAITADASDISYLQREAKIQYNSIMIPINMEMILFFLQLQAVHHIREWLFIKLTWKKVIQFLQR